MTKSLNKEKDNQDQVDQYLSDVKTLTQIWQSQTSHLIPEYTFDGESHINEKTKNLLLYLIDHNVKLYCQNRKSYCQNQIQ